MEKAEALKLKHKLKSEQRQINILRESTSRMMDISISPNLVIKEIQRLTDSTDTTVPLLEGETMHNMLAEFDLYSIEANKNFKQALKSELEEISNPTLSFPATSNFIQEVIDYVEEYVMDYKAARKMKDKLRAERNKIRNLSVDCYYLLQLIDSEIERLSDDIVDAVVLSMRSSSGEIKIPIKGIPLLTRIPTEYYDLSSAAKLQKFIQNLEEELNWVMSLDEEFPLTIEFIQTVIGYLESNKGSAFGQTTTDHKTLGKLRRVIRGAFSCT